MTYQLPPEAQQICEEQGWDDQTLTQLLLQLLSAAVRKEDLDKRIIKLFKAQQMMESPEKNLRAHHIYMLLSDMLGEADGIQVENGTVQEFDFSLLSDGEDFTQIEFRCLGRKWRITVNEITW